MMEMVVRMMEEQGGNCVPDKVVSNGTNSQVRIEKKTNSGTTSPGKTGVFLLNRTPRKNSTQ